MIAQIESRTSFDSERIFALMPAIYRVLDARLGDQPGPLKELIAAIAAEVLVLEENLDQLYDDQFIETCAEWAVPYIGDLLAVRGLLDVRSVAFSQRAYVANTIAYRRRKGTVAALEQLARDVTNWHANAVEFFDLLAASQYLNHLRPHNQSFASVRNHLALNRLNTPFDPFAHTVDVRRIASGRGKHNIPNVGIFLWRLGSYRLRRSPAVALSDGRRYLISPLGSNLHLANHPKPESSIDHLATPFDVPIPIGRRELDADLDAYYGNDASIEIWLGTDDAVASDAITVCDLSDVGATWAHLPDNGGIAIDPVLGRIAVGPDHANTPIWTTFSYRFSAPMGGGEYSRPIAVDPDAAPLAKYVGNPPPDGGSATLQPAIDALLTELVAQGRDDGFVEIVDSGRYELDTASAIEIAADLNVEVRAADGARPTLVLKDADVTISVGAGGRLTFDGLLIAGGAVRVTGQPALVRFGHCTLVPGQTLAIDGVPHHPTLPSLVLSLDGAPGTVVEIDHSIVGPIRLPAEGCSLTVMDSIVDSPVRDSPAARRSALVSGDLAPFLALGAGPLAVTVTIGKEGPYTVSLPAVPGDLASAAGELETAIRAAHSSPAFAKSRVVATANRLIVLPGTPDEVTFADAGPDQTATLLALVPATARRVVALAGGQVPDTLDAGLTGHPFAVTIGNGDPHQITLTPAPATRDEARTRLETALQAVAGDPGFGQAIVAILDDGLLVIPGTAGAAIVIDAAPENAGTLAALALMAAVPAIAGGATGHLSGPETTIVRSTILGDVTVRKLELASDAIFTGPLRTERRQEGCVRFCYLPEGSRTPRRYRCQPAPELDPSRLRPTFTSLQYGDAGYCQLGRGCPVEIARGASDEAEMGAFHDLYQPQREEALRLRLDEYLRFSLEAGIFHAS